MRHFAKARRSSLAFCHSNFPYGRRIAPYEAYFFDREKSFRLFPSFAKASFLDLATPRHSGLSAAFFFPSVIFPARVLDSLRPPPNSNFNDVSFSFGFFQQVMDDSAAGVFDSRSLRLLLLRIAFPPFMEVPRLLLLVSSLRNPRNSGPG